MPTTENPSLVTYRGVADAWECDQMQHMNVQFICERFDQADQFLFASNGFEASFPRLGPVANAERLSFNREIKAGAPLFVESTVTKGATSDEFFVRHQMVLAASGTPCAVAIGRYRDVHPGQRIIPLVCRPSAGEAGTEDEATGFVFDEDLPLVESARASVAAFDQRGNSLSRKLIVRMVNHAASAGLDQGRRWSNSGGLAIGSATLEIAFRRLSFLSDPARLLTVFSGMKARSAKILSAMHKITDANSSALLVEAKSTHMFFDIASRKAIPIPAGVSQTGDQTAAHGPSQSKESP